jgi:hypothetical protein
MRSTAAAIAAGVLLGFTLQAQAPIVEADLDAAQDVLLRSVQEGSAAAYASVTADDWINVGSGGELLTKRQRLEQFGNGTFPTAAQRTGAGTVPYYKRPDYSVRVAGDTAVTMWRNLPSAAEPEGSLQARVWVRVQGRWQQLHIQTTLLTRR